MWIFSFDGPVLRRVVQVQIHLACVCVGEPARLQIDQDQTAEPPMKQEQVDPIPLIACITKTFKSGCPAWPS
jgi:hypothetical protein